MNLPDKNLQTKKTSFFIRDILGEPNKISDQNLNANLIEKSNQISFSKRRLSSDNIRENIEQNTCNKERLNSNKSNDNNRTDFTKHRRSSKNFEKEKRYIISSEYCTKITDHNSYVDPILMTPSPDSDFDLHEKFRCSPKAYSSTHGKTGHELTDFTENSLYKNYPQNYQDVIIQSHNQSLANLRYLCSLQAGFNSKISPFLFGNYGLKNHIEPTHLYQDQNLNYITTENKPVGQWSDINEYSRTLSSEDHHRHVLYDNTPSPSPNLLPPTSPRDLSPTIESQKRRHFPVYLRTVDKESKDVSPTRKPKKCRRSRTVFTEMQMIGLEKRFENQQYLSTPNRVELADLLGLTQLQVKTWYQNRRMKWKKQVLQCGGTEPPTKPKGRPRKVRPDEKPALLIKTS